jgi:hypothetical protein
MQVSGQHLHINLEESSGLHGTHVHVVETDGHDHEAETDVSLLELASGWVKTIAFLFLLVAIFFVVAPFGTQVWVSTAKVFHPLKYSRWRPPLRAPPSSYPDCNSLGS